MGHKTSRLPNQDVEGPVPGQGHGRFDDKMYHPQYLRDEIIPLTKSHFLNQGGDRNSSELENLIRTNMGSSEDSYLNFMIEQARKKYR